MSTQTDPAAMPGVSGCFRPPGHKTGCACRICSPTRQPLTVRYWSKVKRAGPRDCWLWLGGRSHNGYGTFMRSTKNKTRATHIAWELSRGARVPDGLLVLHTCDNPPCVNPAHLFLGTNADNARDKVAKGRARNGLLERDRCGKGHLFTEANTRLAEQRGKTYRDCRMCHRDRQRRRRTAKGSR